MPQLLLPFVENFDMEHFYTYLYISSLKDFEPPCRLYLFELKYALNKRVDNISQSRLQMFRTYNTRYFHKEKI